MSKMNAITEAKEEESIENVAVAEKVTTKVNKPVINYSATTQKMNARQFFDQYPHDNAQVVALIIMLYGNKTKTVAEWEAFYQQMLKKKVN